MLQNINNETQRQSHRDNVLKINKTKISASVLKIYNKGVLDFRPKSKENRFWKSAESAESAISSHFGGLYLYYLLYISDIHTIIRISPIFPSCICKAHLDGTKKLIFRAYWRLFEGDIITLFYTIRGGWYCKSNLNTESQKHRDFYFCYYQLLPLWLRASAFDFFCFYTPLL